MNDYRQEQYTTSEETTPVTANGHSRAAEASLLAAERAAEERFERQERMRATRLEFLTATVGHLPSESIWPYIWEQMPPDPPPPAGQKPKRRKSHTIWAQQIADLMAATEDRGEETNTYLGISCSDCKRSNTERINAENFCTLLALGMDIDILGPAHKETRLPADAEAARALIAVIAFPPSITVATGHGLHCWLLFETPWTWDATDEVTRARAQRLLKAWGDHVTKVGAMLGYAIDNVSDPARVLRIPGTLNRKWQDDGTPLPAVEVTLEAVSGVRYRVEEIEERLGLSSEAEDEAEAEDATGEDPRNQSAEFAYGFAVQVLSRGKRWELMAPFAGMLAHGGIDEKTALRVVNAICDRAKDMDRARELETVRRTYRRKREGQDY